MARGKKNPPAEAAISNGYDGDKIAGYVRKVESYFEEMASEQGAYMSRCRTIRGSIAVVYAEADALGIPRKVLKTHVDLRKLEAKKKNLVQNLDDGEIDSFEQVAEALGDFAALPLGMAALERAPRKAEEAQANAEALDELADGDGEDLRPRFLQDGEPSTLN